MSPAPPNSGKPDKSGITPMPVTMPVTMPGAMPGRIPETARPPADFEPVAIAKGLLRAIRSGSLATLDRNTGHPFASLVNVATDFDGAPLVLVSRLATHTANLEIDARCSILLAETGKGDPLAHPRLTVLGTLMRVERDGAAGERVRRRFLSRHPKSELYAGFPDFSFWRLEAVSAHLNGGFARAADLPAEAVLTDVSAAGALSDAEAGIVAHMNGDHADALRLIATRTLGGAEGAWRLTGVDPEGFDLVLGGQTLRLAFPAPVTTVEGIRSALVEISQSARKI